MDVFGPLGLAGLEIVSSDPVSELFLGRVVYNKTDSEIKIYDGSGWVSVAIIDLAQVLTAKDIDGGTASNTSRITVPKASKSTLDALTRKEGTIVYANDLSKFFIDDGSNLVEVGSGGGGGSINFISDGTFEIGVADWSVSGDQADITRETTGDIARGDASGQIAFTSSSTTSDYVEHEFTLPAGYANSTLRISLLHKDGSAYSNGDIEMVLVKDPGGTETEYIPGQTAIPSTSSWQQLVTTVTVGAADTYALRFKDAQGSTAMDIRVDDITLGPQEFIIVPPSTDWESFTPTGSWTTNTTYTGFKKREGSDLLVQMQITLAGAPNDVALTVDIPDGLTIDTSALLNNNDNYTLGTLNFHDDGSNTVYYGALRYSDSTTLEARIWNAGSTQVRGPDQFTGTSIITVGGTGTDIGFITYRVPIAEWAGSSSYVSTAAKPEYAYNTSTATASSDTTSFGYGPQGAQIQNISAVITRRVRFKTPIQATDKIALQFSEDGTTWYHGDSYESSTGDAITNGYDGSNTFGVFTRVVSGSNTDVDIKFRNKSFGTNNWSNLASSYWRVVKIPGHVQVAYPTAVKWQEKILSADVSGASDGDVAGLSFTGLTVGKTYKISLQARIQVDGGTNTFRMSYYDQASGAGNIIARYDYDELESSNQVKTAVLTTIFTAQTSTLYLRRESAATNDTIFGDSTRGESFAVLEQLDTYTETDEW